jgi:hypothetical protein
MSEIILQKRVCLFPQKLCYFLWEYTRGLSCYLSLHLWQDITFHTHRPIKFSDFTHHSPEERHKMFNKPMSRCIFRNIIMLYKSCTESPGAKFCVLKEKHPEIQNVNLISTNKLNYNNLVNLMLVLLKITLHKR